jgi:hypothetical protein
MPRNPGVWIWAAPKNATFVIEFSSYVFDTVIRALYAVFASTAICSISSFGVLFASKIREKNHKESVNCAIFCGIIIEKAA